MQVRTSSARHRSETGHREEPACRVTIVPVPRNAHMPTSPTSPCAIWSWHHQQLGISPKYPWFLKHTNCRHSRNKPKQDATSSAIARVLSPKASTLTTADCKKIPVCSWKDDAPCAWHHIFISSIFIFFFSLFHHGAKTVSSVRPYLEISQLQDEDPLVAYPPDHASCLQTSREKTSILLCSNYFFFLPLVQILSNLAGLWKYSPG